MDGLELLTLVIGALWLYSWCVRRVGLGHYDECLHEIELHPIRNVTSRAKPGAGA